MSRENYVRGARMRKIWGEEALDFQEKLLNSSGLGDETYFPDSARAPLATSCPRLQRGACAAVMRRVAGVCGFSLASMDPAECFTRPPLRVKVGCPSRVLPVQAGGGLRSVGACACPRLWGHHMQQDKHAQVASAWSHVCSRVPSLGTSLKAWGASRAA